MFHSLKPLLYQLEPEWVHEATLDVARAVGSSRRLERLVEILFDFEDQRLTVEMGPLSFPNPVGLAAGFDKNGVALSLLYALGFGAVEVGTLTPRPQPGNPQPRLFRLVEDQAIINRMGFNNHGVEAFVAQVRGRKFDRPLGVNLGKNKGTPNDQAAQDYCIGLEKAYEVADYFTINISSPNTVGLRDLQSEESLVPLLKALLEQRQKLANRSGKKKPLWLKIAPDLNRESLTVVCQIALELKLDALVLTNTTLERPGLKSLNGTQAGGLSGQPLASLSNQALDFAFGVTGGKLPLVGVGGIFSAQDAWTKLELGASLVQVYTGLIFEGPGLVRKIKQGLVERLNQQRAYGLPKRVVQSKGTV